MKAILILIGALALASCTGTISLLPDGTVIVEPDPIVIEPEK